LIRAILFDFGNVVAFFDHTRATRRFAESSPMPPADMYAAIYDNELEHEFESGRLSADAFVGRVMERIAYRGRREQLHDAFIDIFTPNPAVIAAVPRLKPNYRLVLASNTNPLHYGHYREQFADTLRHFDAVALSYEAGVRKPAAAYFDYAVRLAGCRPGECLFIDDMTLNVAGAHSSGLHGLVYQPEVDLPRALREFGVELTPAGSSQ
jgi:putative hydrolase of the HAD superfamily